MIDLDKLTPEQKARLLHFAKNVNQSINEIKKFSNMTNEELAATLIETVAGEINIFSTAANLLEVVHDRLLGMPVGQSYLDEIINVDGGNESE